MRPRPNGGTVAAVVAALVVVFLSGLAWAGFTPPPRPDTAVADTADVLTPEQEEALRARLRALRERTGVSFVVATMPTLDGTDIKQASHETFDAWGVGGPENRGLLFTVYVDEARAAGPGAKRCGCIRLEVGRYLEGDVTDTATKRVLKKVGPVVVTGDFDKALNLAVDGVEGILGPEHEGGVASTSDAEDQPSPGVGALIFVIVFGVIAFVGVFFLLGLRTTRAGPTYRRSPTPRPRPPRRTGASSSTPPSTPRSYSDDGDDGDDAYVPPPVSSGYSRRSDDSTWSSGWSGSSDSDDSDFFGGGSSGGGGSDW